MSDAHAGWMDRHAPTRKRNFTQAMEDRRKEEESNRDVGYVASRMRLDAERARAEDEARSEAEAEPDHLTAIGRGIAASERPERKVNTATIEIAVRMILEAVGEDLSRPDLRNTPARVARFYRALIEHDPGTLDTSFADERASDQMVTVAGVRVWSLCAHHMLPFYTDVSMGYIPAGRVLGLSKFARIAHAVASGLRTQEQVAAGIADKIEQVTGTESVAVVCENGMHTCATMRGIKTPLSMNNAVMRGVFRTNPSACTEFYNLIQRSRIR